MAHTLLLADDSVTIQRVIELTFADEDVRVIAVSNGDEAIAVLDRTPPDIVLADVGMPGPSGYDVARHVKNTPHLAHIPVVLLTGAFEPIDQARAAAVGCDGVLAKPFEPQLVIGRVRELLARPKQGGTSPLAPAPPAWTRPEATAKAAAPSGVSDYFDRLDQAFANLPSAAPPETQQIMAPPPTGADIDWFGTRAPASAAAAVPDTWEVPTLQNPPDLPLSFGSPQTGFDRLGGPGASPFAAPAAPASHVLDRAPAAEVAHPPTPAAPLPPLADAFAALLAAERSAPAPAATPVWPPPPAASVPVDLVEQVTRSVLDRLSDRIVRETVRDIVSAVAERLVREEIERIKSNIK